MKRTKWFSGDIHPVRSGEYECRACGKGLRHYWTGSHWKISKDSFIELRNSFMWRGVKK